MIAEIKCLDYIGISSSHKGSSQTSFTAWMLPVEERPCLGKACALGCASATFTPLFSAFALVAVCQTSAPWLCVMWAFCTERRSALPEAQPLLGEEQLGPSVHTLPYSDVFENRISHF